MNAADLIKLPGTLTRVTGDGPPDDYNNPTDETVTASVLCWYEQASADEDTVDTAQQAQTHRLYFRAGANVTGYDRLAVNGLEFEVLGPPWEAIHPRTGVASHIEARGRMVV